MLGSALCFTGIGWGWTGNAPAFVSPTACFVGSVICAGGALLSAHGAHQAERAERASARRAALISVLLLLVPIGLFSLLIFLLSQGGSSIFT
jgi:hypothetical protein